MDKIYGAIMYICMLILVPFTTLTPLGEEAQAHGALEAQEGAAELGEAGR